MATIEARNSSLEAEFSTSEIQMKSLFKELDAQKDLLDQLNVEFTKTVGLTEVVGPSTATLPQRSTKWARGSTGLRRPRRGRTRATFRSKI